MKASKLLSLYAEGKRDFRRANLCGQSFEGKDLSEANFSKANIRGTNFTNAILRGANFTEVEAGQQLRWQLCLSVVVFPILLLSSGAAFLQASFPLVMLYWNKNSFAYGAFLVFVCAIILFHVMAFRAVKDQGINAVIYVILIVLVLAGAAFIAASASTMIGLLGWFVVVVFGLVSGINYTQSSILDGATIVGNILGFLLILFIAWQIVTEDKRTNLIQKVAIAITTLGGTSFRGADLTDASFTKAKLRNLDLRSTSLRKTIILRTNWFKPEIFDGVRAGDTYLKDIQIQNLATNRQANGANFDRRDLRGLNLQEAYLSGASFIDTDLSYANLQEADLSNAKLVRTNLDHADLTGAILTGAYIEDWGITRKTKLDTIKCDYVYMRLPTEEDPNPQRIPPQEKFNENDFQVFVTTVLDTLDLYHKHEINPSVAITVLKGMTEKYPVKFELVALENRRNRQFVIKLKVYGQTSHYQLQKEYYSQYEQELLIYDPEKYLLDTETVTEVIAARFIEGVKERVGTQIVTDQIFVINEGDVTMNGENVNVQQHFHSSVTGVAGNVQGNQIIFSEHRQTLAKAAHEIQQLLKQLETREPDATDARKKEFVTREIAPTRRQQFLSALDAGWKEAIKEFLDNSYLNVVVAILEGWKNSKG